VVTSTGVNVAGTLNATGNANVGNIGATNANLTALTTTGNANVGNLLGKVGSTKILKEELHIVEEDIAEYNLRLKAEVTQRYINYVVRQAVLSSKSKTAVETESLVKQVQYKFEKSEETLENYSRIINNYYAAIQSKLEAEGELLKAKSAIEELLGTPLESIK
jgi:outer membrane protein TolC